MCDICHLYHGPLISKASCVFGELRFVPRECGLNVVFKTSLESCRNLFAGFHIGTFRWWSWEHQKMHAAFVLVHFHMFTSTQMLLCSVDSVVSNCQSSAEKRRQRNVILKKQEEADQPQVLHFHSSPPLRFDFPYYISVFAIGQNSPKTWCFCRRLLVTQMHVLWF